MQPLDIETYLRTKCLSYFDEFNDVPQGTCFHKKKKGPQIFGAFQKARGHLSWLKEFVKLR